MNDALKKKLMGLMNRPELTSLDDIEGADVQDENIDDALGQTIEDPQADEEEFEVSPEVQAQVKDLASSKLDIPSIQGETEKSVGLPEDKYQADPKMMEMLKRLKAGGPMEDTEVAQETINDTSAPMEMRKAAIEKIKQKYLGR
jgi:hypothetical protein